MHAVSGRSQGADARLGMIAAEAHRHDLLLSKSPLGTGSVVRRGILEADIRQGRMKGDGYFSSTLLDAVEGSDTSP